MKTKLFVLCCLTGAIVLSFSYRGSMAKSKKDEGKNTTLTIGVVNIRKIFQDSKRYEKYKKRTQTEEEKILQELRQMRAEIISDEDGLRTLRQDSSDYLELAQKLAQKKAALPIRQDYYDRQFALKDQQWTEKFYKDILELTTLIAKEKGLDLVFEKDQPEFPINSFSELMLTIRTNKLIYSNGCTDITEDVMTRVDAVDND